MGLAGVKKRRKLAHDPNNTRWSRNEDRFGQKILRQQGWQPGQYLGVQDAAHASHHTAASASHIRVTLRENNAGIGMKLGSSDECTGLGAFHDLLGRLNGKSDEKIQLENQIRNNYKSTLYIERKYGGMRFVRGGLLVGDKIEGLKEDEAAVAKGSQSPSSDEYLGSGADGSKEGSKKRKKDKKGKKEKKSKKRKQGSDAEETGEYGARKKRRKSEDAGRSRVGSAEAVQVEVCPDTADGNPRKSKRIEEEKAKAKAEKLERKKKKKALKERSEEIEAGDGDADSSSESKVEKKEKKKKKKRSKEDQEQATETEAPSAQVSLATSREPSASGTSTPQYQPVGPRRFHRSKFIASKRAAMLDQTALNQIFMVKSAAAS